MPNTEDQLRGMFLEHSSQPPANPDRLTQTKAAIRRRRHRRTALAGSGVTAVAAAAVVLTTVPLGLVWGPDTPPLTSTSRPAAPPKRFTSSDGASYRLIATTSMRSVKRDRVTLKVPVRGNKPLDVGATCAMREGPKGPSASPAFPPMIDVLYGPSKDVQLTCMEKLTLAPLAISQQDRAGGEIQIEFLRQKVGGGLTAAPAAWSFGVYEWTPPNRPVTPPTPPEPADPLTDGGRPIYDLVTQRHGTWPADREARFTIPYHRRRLLVLGICRGEIAGRMGSIGIYIDGKRVDSEICDFVDNRGVNLTGIGRRVLDRADKNGSVTIDVRIPGPTADGQNSDAYRNRPFSWRIAVYEAPEN
jgi:hypothetical protein